MENLRQNKTYYLLDKHYTAKKRFTAKRQTVDK